MKPWEQMEFESVASRPASLEVIKSFEKLAGNNLPGEYRAFVLEVNGGRPVHPTAPNPEEYPVVSIDWEGRPPAESTGIAIVDYLLSAEDWADTYVDGKNDSLTLAGCYRVFALEEPRIPRGFIPIGTDPGGSLFLLDVGGKRPGSVWFWSRDWFDYDQWDKDPFQNVGFVAPSFSEFMEKIRFKTID